VQHVLSEGVVDIAEEKFRHWTAGKAGVESRIPIFERIRDIPYAVISEQIDSMKYVNILRTNRGSCTPKHFLLSDMFRRLGLTVLYAVYPFRWDEVELDYPPELRKLAKELPLSHHLACRVDINERLVLVDATLDPALAKLGLPVNVTWDGVSDTQLPLVPSGAEELYCHSEAGFIVPDLDDTSLKFYRGLNRWLDEVRESVG
jgi:hypothetical protein